MREQHIGYQGERVFIGIDVHKRFYAVACFHDGTIVKSCRMPARPEILVSFCRKFFPDAEIYSVYEAGFSGFVLDRYLRRNGIHNIVVHPAGVEVAARNRVKTDKRDSKKLAIQLAAGRLVAIRIPNEAEELRRLLTRTRTQLVRHRTRIKNQIRMKFHQFGLLDPEHAAPLGRRFVQQVLQRGVPDELRVVTEILFATWTAIDAQLRRLMVELHQQSNSDHLDSVFRSLPGIGPCAARILANELGDLSRFSNQKRLYSFTGLTPREFSSGETRRLGHISRQGAGRLRHVLIEAAWIAIRKDEGLAADFERIAKRAGKKRAIVAIARRLVGRARALFRTGSTYEVRRSEAA